MLPVSSIFRTLGFPFRKVNCGLERQGLGQREAKAKAEKEMTTKSMMTMMVGEHETRNQGCCQCFTLLPTGAPSPLSERRRRGTESLNDSLEVRHCARN